MSVILSNAKDPGFLKNKTWILRYTQDDNAVLKKSLAQEVE